MDAVTAATIAWGVILFILAFCSIIGLMVVAQAMVEVLRRGE